MSSTTIDSLVDFITLTEDIGALSNLMLFRGQSVRGRLLPGIARAKPTKNTERVERTMLDQLRLQGASLLGDAAESDLDVMIKAQHFGMKTRLLDWTSNPLAALWFACVDQLEGDTYVYALEADDLLDNDVYKKSPFSTARTRVIQPRLNNARVQSQHGWFTLHRYSSQAKRFVALDVNPQVKGHVHEVHVPEDARRTIRHALDRVGVTSSTLFPDLPGLCASQLEASCGLTSRCSRRCIGAWARRQVQLATWPNHRYNAAELWC